MHRDPVAMTSEKKSSRKEPMTCVTAQAFSESKHEPMTRSGVEGFTNPSGVLKSGLETTSFLRVERR